MKKLIVYITIFSFINLVGCSSSKVTTAYGEDIKTNLREIENTKDIYISTDDGIRYYFASYKYQIKSDTLIGNGLILNQKEHKEFECKIALIKINELKFTPDVENWREMVAGGLIIIGVIALAVIMAFSWHSESNPK